MEGENVSGYTVEGEGLISGEFLLCTKRSKSLRYLDTLR